MAKIKFGRRAWLAGSAGTLSVIASVAMMAASSGGASASMSVHRIARPDTHRFAAASASTAKSYPVTPFVQDFQANTRFFCPAKSGNLPCDGKINADYGTIDRVPSGFSNGGAGNYAPFTKALKGNWMALISGSGMPNQGAACPNPAVEACTGPYALFGTGKAQGSENVFPSKGFTVTNDLYLSPSTAGPAGSVIDDDVELNLSHTGSYGYYGIDNVITTCPETGGFTVSFGNGSPGSCLGTPVVTKDGWYRFVFMFSNKGGKAYLTESVRSESTGALVATSGSLPVGGTPTPITNWGGPGYFWLPTLQVSGMPLANFALQLGQFRGGHKP